MSCDPSRPECSLGECEQCPGTDHDKVKEKLLQDLEERGVEVVTYKQWLSTDRCDLLTVENDLDDFCDILCKKLEILRPHDYIARQQASFLVDLKEQLNPSEVITICDFSENYGFLIQDAVQGYHWTNLQATIHPFITYYKADDVIQSISSVMISDCMSHDTALLLSVFSEGIDADN